MKEIGQYEKAQYELNYAIWFKGRSTCAYPGFSQGNEINALVENETSDSARYAFRMEMAQNSLDSANNRRWNLEDQYFKNSYLASAKTYYDDALNYDSIPTELGARIDSKISSIPLDTVYQNSPFINDQIYLQPYNIHSNRLRALHFMQQQDTVFYKRDSSLYNGVLVRGANLESFRGQKPSYPNQTTGQGFSTIKNGLIESQSSHSYSFALIYNSNQTSSYIFHKSAVSIFDSCFFQFNHLGDTILYKYYKLNGDDYLALNSKKDTVGYAQSYFENGIKTRNSVEYRSNGDILFFSQTTHYPDSIVRFEGRMNENGDTTIYDCMVNDNYRYGLEWDTYSLGYDDPLFRITRRWERNKLRDILNENIIYVNAENEIIDKSEYIRTLNSTWDRQLYHAKNYYNVILPPADSLIIVYVNDDILRSGKRKYTRSVKSILKQYKKANP
ncbi:MAG: hypothetical protein GQ574_19545 [Crocinitomix sp.]|nr:hypothetical protein [Crocinitomix sp.]